MDLDPRLVLKNQGMGLLAHSYFFSVLDASWSLSKLKVSSLVLGTRAQRKQGIQVRLSANGLQQPKESSCLDLSNQNVRVFHRALTQIAQQHVISCQLYSQNLMNKPKLRTTSIRFVSPWQQPQANKHLKHSLYSCQFIRDTTQNGVITEQVPFRDDVCWSTVRVSWNVVIAMTQYFWIETNQKHCQLCQSNLLHQIFCIEIWVKIHQISLCTDSQWVSRPILVQLSQMSQTQSGQNKRHQIVQAVKTIQCWIVHTETTPQPVNDGGTDHGNSTSQASDNGPSPQGHLQLNLFNKNRHTTNYFGTGLQFLAMTTPYGEAEQPGIPLREKPIIHVMRAIILFLLNLYPHNLSGFTLGPQSIRYFYFNYLNINNNIKTHTRFPTVH